MLQWPKSFFTVGHRWPEPQLDGTALQGPSCGPSSPHWVRECERGREGGMDGWKDAPVGSTFFLSGSLPRGSGPNLTAGAGVRVNAVASQALLFNYSCAPLACGHGGVKM